MSSHPGNPLVSTALRWGALFALGLAVVAGGIGMLVAGLPGLWGGLLGAGLAFAFLGLTAGSILLGQRLTVGDPNSPVFYGVVLGGWLLKLVVFFILLFWLRSQDFLDPWVFFLTVVVAVFGSLAIDAASFVRTRTPYVDAALPGEDVSPE